MKAKYIFILISLSFILNSCLTTAIVGGTISKTRENNKSQYKGEINVGDYFMEVPISDREFRKSDNIVIITETNKKYIFYQYVNSKNTRIFDSERKFFIKRFSPVK